MKVYIIAILSSLMLLGCSALNFQTEPKIEQDCQYDRLMTTEFRFVPLTVDSLLKGYTHIYVAQSKSSATLSADYQGVKGKLTENIIERNYPKLYRRGERPWFFGNTSFYDNDYNDFYLTPKQREEQLRKTKSIFQQAILENCQVVYILIDSLNRNQDNSTLIAAAGLQIIN